jgi:hypothetical protein
LTGFAGKAGQNLFRFYPLRGKLEIRGFVEPKVRGLTA